MRFSDISSLLLLSSLWVTSSYGLIGYDCTHRDLNITSFSLTQIGSCQIHQPEIETKNVTIQLVQLAKTRSVQVKQCLVEITRSVTRCSWFNDAQAVLHGTASYVVDISADECNRLHRDKVLNLYGTIHVTNLNSNTSTRQPIVLAGDITYDGKCSGAPYSDNLGSWTNVVVQGSVLIKMRDFVVPVALDTERLLLPNGVTCPYQRGECQDGDYSVTVWDKALPSNCRGEDYDVLYHGPATVISGIPTHQVPHPPVVYSVETSDIIFALTAGRRRRLCLQESVETEHPRLFILLDNGMGFAKPWEKIDVYNTDLFTYINSKFVYLEKHLQRQISNMYSDLIHQKCLLETEVIRQKLSLATISLSEFSYLQGGGPGHTAILAGEVIYLIKCQPVVVSLRVTERCYQEVAVSYLNRSLFMTPKNRILQNYGSEISCSAILPNLYLLDNQWYSLNPSVQPARQPQILSPQTKTSWEYVQPGHLATSGIYTEDSLDRLSDHIMYPLELPAITNTLARTLVVADFDRQNLRYSQLLDEVAVGKIARSAWRYLWGWFGTLGDIVSGIIGLYMVFRIIKFGLDTILHCLLIHNTFGMSWRLIASLWDSATNYLLHKNSRKEFREKEVTPMMIKMEEGESKSKTYAINSTEEKDEQEPISRQPLYPGLPPHPVRSNNRNPYYDPNGLP